MLSGVGPGGHLLEMGIEIVFDNAEVGENLQDHPGCFLDYPARIAAETGDGWIEAGGFARTGPEPLPDIQFHAAVGSFADGGVSTGRAPALSSAPTSPGRRAGEGSACARRCRRPSPASSTTSSPTPMTSRCSAGA